MEWDLVGTSVILPVESHSHRTFRIVALLLGHFRMNLNEAVRTLLEVVSAVFLKEPQQAIDRDAKSKQLKEAIENILEARDIPLDTKMNDPERTLTKCKVYVVSLSCIPTSQFFPELYMQQRQLESTILKLSVPIPRTAPVSTQPSSKQCVLR